MSFTVQSLNYHYIRDDTEDTVDDVYSTEYQLSLQYRVPEMFTVQSIDYRYSRDDTKDDVYSTEHRLLLQ